MRSIRYWFQSGISGCIPIFFFQANHKQESRIRKCIYFIMLSIVFQNEVQEVLRPINQSVHVVALTAVGVGNLQRYLFHQPLKPSPFAQSIFPIFRSSNLTVFSTVFFRCFPSTAVSFFLCLQSADTTWEVPHEWQTGTFTSAVMFVCLLHAWSLIKIGRRTCRSRSAHMQTDRQEDKADRQTYRQGERQTDRYKNRQMGR